MHFGINETVEIQFRNISFMSYGNKMSVENDDIHFSFLDKNLEVTKNIEHDSPPSHKNNIDKLKPLFSNFKCNIF